MSDNNEITMVETASGEWVSSAESGRGDEAFFDSLADPSGKRYSGGPPGDVTGARYVAWVWGIMPIAAVVIQRLLR